MDLDVSCVRKETAAIEEESVTGGLKIGVIGVGGAGRAHSVRFLRHPNVTEVRGYDIKPVDFDRIKVFGDFEEFIEPLDAVSICSPDDSHAGYIVECFARGKHVLVEKPMVASLEEAQELETVIANKGPLKFGVHHQMRFVPAFAKAKELMDSGVLGDVFYAEANYWHDMRERSRKYDDWRIRGKGQSVIYGGACHPLDLLLYLFGDDNPPVDHVTYVNKIGFPEYPLRYTDATTLLRMRSGATCKCNTNISVRFPQFNNLTLLGEKATYIDGLLYDGANVTDLASESAYQGRLRRLVRGGSSALVKALTHMPSFRINPMSVYDHEHACDVIIKDFVRSILEDRDPLVGYLDGKRVVSLCEETEKDGLERLAPIDG